MSSDNSDRYERFIKTKTLGEPGPGRVRCELHATSHEACWDPEQHPEDGIGCVLILYLARVPNVGESVWVPDIRLDKVASIKKQVFTTSREGFMSGNASTLPIASITHAVDWETGEPYVDLETKDSLEALGA